MGENGHMVVCSGVRWRTEHSDFVTTSKGSSVTRMLDYFSILVHSQQ